MKTENAINFLLFSNMGITLCDEEEIIIDGIINRAYRDASSHVLSVIEDNDQCKNIAKTHIKKFLEDIINKDFVISHKACANSLVNEYLGKTDKKLCFTYGIAQKWLNMSVKYLVVALKIFEKYNPENKFYIKYKDSIEIIEQNCDIPIDDFILEAVSQTERKKNKITTGLYLKIASKKGSEPVSYTSGKYLTWSKYNSSIDDWNDENDNYHRLQKDIKENVKLNSDESILDWENNIWIKVAKLRNRK